jgi:outer membrane protein TolC
MDQVVAKALAAGYDNAILQDNLEISRQQQALTEAKNSFALSGKLAYTANGGLLGAYKDKDAMLGVPTPEQMNSTGSAPVSAAQAAANAAQGNSSYPIPQTITGSLSAAVPGTGGTPFTSIGLNASHKLQSTAHTDGSPTDTTNSSTTVGVALSQTVWDGMVGGQPKANIDRSHLVLQVQEQGARNNQLSLVLKIRQAFLTMLVAQKNLDVLANISARQATLAKQAKLKYDLQQATRIDLLNSQISARNADLDLQNGTNNFVAAREALSLLMGMDAKTNYRVEEPPVRSLPAPSLQEAIAKAMSQRSDWLQLDLNSQASQIDLALGQAAANPVVSINGGVNFSFNWITNNRDDQRQTGTFYAGLSLGMPILDAGQSAAQVANATRQLSVYQKQKAQLARTISMQIETAWNNCQILQGRVETARQSVEVLTLQYKIVQNQEASGTATIKDDLNAAANLSSAELALLQAEYNLQTAVLNLENSMGQ